MVLFATVSRNSAGSPVVHLREQNADVDFARFTLLGRASGAGVVDVYAEDFGVWLRARSRKSVPVTIASFVQDTFPQLDAQCIFPVPFV